MSNTQFIQCTKTNDGSKPCKLWNSSGSSCSEEGGTIISKNSKYYLCLGKIGNSDTSAELEFGISTTGSRYIVKHNKHGIFSLDTSANYYIIKGTTDSIELDNSSITGTVKYKYK